MNYTYIITNVNRPDKFPCPGCYRIDHKWARKFGNLDSVIAFCDEYEGREIVYNERFKMAEIIIYSLWKGLDYE